MKKEINDFALQVNKFKEKWFAKSTELLNKESLEYHEQKESLEKKLKNIEGRIGYVEPEKDKQWFKLEFHKVRQKYLEIALDISMRIEYSTFLQLAQTPARLSTSLTKTSKKRSKLPKRRKGTKSKTKFRINS